MTEATLLKILVTVWLAGQPPITQLLPKEYPSMRVSSCEQHANSILARKRKGVRMTVECVPALTRAT
jgi:hypothetical protein